MSVIKLFKDSISTGLMLSKFEREASFNLFSFDGILHDISFDKNIISDTLKFSSSSKDLLIAEISDGCSLCIKNNSDGTTRNYLVFGYGCLNAVPDYLETVGLYTLDFDAETFYEDFKKISRENIQEFVLIDFLEEYKSFDVLNVSFI